jgi:hypothetical protein
MALLSLQGYCVVCNDSTGFRVRMTSSEVSALSLSLQRSSCDTHLIAWNKIWRNERAKSKRLTSMCSLQVSGIQIGSIEAFDQVIAFREVHILKPCSLWSPIAWSLFLNGHFDRNTDSPSQSPSSWYPTCRGWRRLPNHHRQLGLVSCVANFTHCATCTMEATPLLGPEHNTVASTYRGVSRSKTGTSTRRDSPKSTDTLPCHVAVVALESVIASPLASMRHSGSAMVMMMLDTPSS